MRKIAALLLAALLLMGMLAGCGEKQPEEPVKTPESPVPTEAAPTPAPTQAPAPAETPAPTEPPPATPTEPVSADGSVIFEKDGVKVTTAGLDLDPTYVDAQPIIWVDITNSGSSDAYLGVTGGSVNGFMSTVLLADFYEEDGRYIGGNYTDSQTIPAGGGGRYALCYYKADVPGVKLDTLSELEFCFTTAEDEFSWPNYTSGSVVIRTGTELPPADIASLGTVVIDDERLLLVIGGQDYNDWFGPTVDVYCENRTDRYLAVNGVNAEADGIVSDEFYFGERLAPGKRSAGTMSFEGEIRELRGIENLSITFSLLEGESLEAISYSGGEVLEPVTVAYPPQVWGEYVSGGLTLEVQPKYNELITVETPESDPDGTLFAVYETASRAAGSYEGAGWLFSIRRIGVDALRQLLCWDMSGAEVFAKDAEGNYYLYCHPTDVRYERATPEEMERDAEQWTMLNAWSREMQDGFREMNGLEYASFDNSEVAMYVARAAWMENAEYTLSTTAFGPLDPKGVDGTPYANFVLEHFFWEADPAETPDGEYVVLSFPEEDLRLDFFTAPGDYVRVVRGETEQLYEAVGFDDKLRLSEGMEGWYYAAAGRLGLMSPDTSLEPFLGSWHEQIAGRGTIILSESVAPGKAKIEASWPDSVSVRYTWDLVASLDEDGMLRYADGTKTVYEYDEDGSEWVLEEGWEENGWFELSDAGELIWHDESAGNSRESVFVR